MSVQLTPIVPDLQTCTNSVVVRQIDGTTQPATQVGTYQINPTTGASELVLDSLYYIDGAGNRIFGATLVKDSPTAAPLPSTRYWFSSPTGAPIYVEGGQYYNADGSLYEGSTTGYIPQAGGNQTACCPDTIQEVWAKYGDTYVPLTQTTDNSSNVVSYSYEGMPVVPTAPIVTSLPAPTYIERFDHVVSGGSNTIPTDLPISGVAITWLAPLPTTTSQIASRVLLDGVQLTTATANGLQSEDPMGTVIPPIVQTEGRAVADVTYRLRTSPLLADADAALNLLAVAPQFDAPSSVEPTYEAEM